MNELTSIIKDTKPQLKQHFLMLFSWMFFTKVLGAVFFELLDTSSLSASLIQGLSFLGNMLNIVIGNTVMFLFIKTVREEAFHVSDIVSSVKMILYHIVMGLILSILQAFMQQVAYLFGIVPMLAYVLIFLIQAFFLYWNGIIAFAICDHDKAFSDYISGALRMLFNNYKMILVMSLPYVLLCITSQLVASSVFVSVFGNVEHFSHILESLGTAGNGIGMVLLTYALFYGVQIMFLVVMLMIIAHLYDRYASIYLPGKGK